MIDISFIKYPTNLVFTHRAHPPPIVILVYFEGPLVLNEVVYRSYIGDDIDMSEKRDAFKIPTEGGPQLHHLQPRLLLLSQLGHLLWPHTH